MQQLFEWCYQQSFLVWWGISLAGNLAGAGLSIFCCWLLPRMFWRDRIFDAPQPLTSSDLVLSAGAILLNSVVSLVGWVLWRQGWIVIRDSSFLPALADTILLIIVMDFAMYCFHRMAHHPILFRIVHASHHVHESTNPLSLFVLNPFEVFGFGFLLTVALILYPFSGVAVLAYLAFNLIFGTVGHLGVEPLPACLRRLTPFRYIGTSTFHGLHHGNSGYNFGFYTTCWDRLFRTLDPNYDSRFGPQKRQL